MDAKLEKTNMVLLNDFLRVYANIDVNKGYFGLYTEVAAKDGKFDGYVKPLITDLDIVEWTKEEGSFLQIAYESLVGAAAWLLKNHKKDQLATKVYLSGKLDDPKIKIGKAISIILENAFVAALKPAIDREINLSTINKSDKDDNVFDRIIENSKERKKERVARKEERKAKKEKKGTKKK